MKIKVRKRTIADYLSYITIGWFAHHDFEADSIEEYAPLVDSIKLQALKQGDLAYLRLGLMHLYLLSDDRSLQRYAGGRYPWKGNEIREIIHFIIESIWPETVITEESITNTVMEDMSPEEWSAYKSTAKPPHT